MPTWRETAKYFQNQADRTRNADRKAHYLRCAEECRRKAQNEEQKSIEKGSTARDCAKPPS